MIFLNFGDRVNRMQSSPLNFYVFGRARAANNSRRVCSKSLPALPHRPGHYVSFPTRDAFHTNEWSNQSFSCLKKCLSHNRFVAAPSSQKIALSPLRSRGTNNFSTLQVKGGKLLFFPYLIIVLSLLLQDLGYLLIRHLGYFLIRHSRALLTGKWGFLLIPDWRGLITSKWE
jgi:hypothetical protein